MTCKQNKNDKESSFESVKSGSFFIRIILFLCDGMRRFEEQVIQMEQNEKLTNGVDYKKWMGLTNTITLIIVLAIFGIEIMDNAILYITRAQGYGPDTIAAKLLRYLVLTSAINFALFFLSYFLTRRKCISNKIKPYIQLLALDMIFGNVAISHYQFACTLCVIALPVMFSLFFEDRRLNTVTAFVAWFFQLIAILFRINDSVYGKDMIPEAAIAICFMMFLWIVCGICIDHMNAVSGELEKARIAEEEVKLAQILKLKNEELEKLYVSVIEALSKAVDFNEPYTAGHSKRVATYARDIARHLGMDEENVQSIYYAGLLHDVGKLGIDNSIIKKEGRLSDVEFAEVQKHPQMGYEILKDIVLREDYALGAKYHHERFDGKGYPNHCTDIPMVGRIIIVADAYDAMTSRRSYRDVMPQDKVREQICRGRGTQFDPDVADVMLQMIDEDKDYLMKQSG